MMDAESLMADLFPIEVLSTTVSVFETVAKSRSRLFRRNYALTPHLG